MMSLVLSVCVSIEHVCLSVIYMAGHVYMDICGVYVCLVCVYAENASAASLQLRLEDMKQEQPHLSQAVEYI